MEPESSPGIDLCRLVDCVDPDGFLERLNQPPTPADSLVPSILLGLAVLVLVNRDSMKARLGWDENANKVIVVGMLIAAIAIAGIRISNSPAYTLSNELGLGIDIALAYGLPAMVALAVGFLVGLGLLGWHESAERRTALLRSTDTAGVLRRAEASDITLADIAQQTGLSTSTLRRDASSGKLGARRVGGRWVTTEEELRRYVAARNGTAR